DQEKAATRDVGVVARMFGTGSDAMNFLIYHSGYDGDGPSGSLGGPLNQGTSAGGPYPLDIAPDGTPERGAGSEDTVRSIDRGVDNLIKALRENGWSARHFASGGSPGTALQAGDGDPLEHGNVPNVYAELGSVWGSVLCAGQPQNESQTDQVCPSNTCDRASWLLGKLIYYVGPKRIVWGTDALWGGSPQGLIVAFRCFSMAEPARELYNLPHGLDGDVDDPTINAVTAGTPARSIRNAILGRNAATVYGIDPAATLQAISCSDAQSIRSEYLVNPLASHEIRGPRTRRELFAALRQDPWHRGAVRAQNETGFLRRNG
ncbi:MAG: hypothetical protein ACREQ9_26565, partial [Candidatus Binatia bacterium]